ncbi:MAG TPA: SpoIID/LytB domain-containing protein [Actinomycetota bacterium]|nr:SpoIID/LytB domain-containing protein [Actinomycetota bacterium]
MRRGIIRAISSAILAIAATLAPAASSPAQAADYTFVGSGWGHGLGMSQWGAKGGADAGASYSSILGRYYSGTAVQSKAMPAEIRIGLVQGASSISIGGSGRFDFVMDGRAFATGSAGQTWSVTPGSDGSFAVRSPSGQTTRVGNASKWVAVRFQPYGTVLTTSGGRYKHGWLELNVQSTSSGYRLISILHPPFEAYLYGLGEVPSSWPVEALKAQATAARTYALEKMLRVGVRSSCNCHLYDDTRDQAYIGYDKETASGGSRWRSAVDSTAGKVVTYDGRPIQAYYSSSSGGHTEHNENVWGGSALPYLRGVSDPWDRAVSPYIDWRVTYTKSELETKLNSSASTAVGSLSSIELLDPKGVSGRIGRVIDSSRGGVRITGSSGVKRVSGDTVRSVLGLRSTLFRIEGATTPPPPAPSAAAVHPDGALLKGSGSMVWVLRDGSRVPIPSGAVYESSFRWDEISHISDGSVARYAEGKRLFRDGSLLRTSDGRLWIVSNGARRELSSAVATSLGYSSAPVVAASASEAALHPVGSPVSSSEDHPDGTVLKGTGAMVWVIEQGYRRPFPTFSIFSSHFDSSRIVHTSDSRVSAFTEGAPMLFREGTLMGTPDGKVWAVSDGHRRWIPGPGVFSALGYQSSNVRSASDAEAALHPVGTPVTATGHPDGSLIKGTGSMVWVMQDGSRIPIPSGSVYESNYRWSEIAHISDSAVARYAEGRKLFSEGTLLRWSDGRVWVVSNGQRLPLSSAAFSALGYSGKPLVNASASELALHPVGEALTDGMQHPDGSLLKGSAAMVWYVEQGRRRAIPSWEILLSRFRPERIITTSDSRINSYPEGSPLGFRDGTLIGTSDGRVWAVSDGHRRWIPGPTVFSELGYSSSNVKAATAAEAALHPPGTPL